MRLNFEIVAVEFVTTALTFSQSDRLKTPLSIVWPL
jgi:hypothetical protein